MQCPTCGKTSAVIISGKSFCSNCGTKLGPAPTRPSDPSMIKGSQTLDLRQAGTAKAQAARPAARPANNPAPTSAPLDLRTKPGLPPSPAQQATAAVAAAPAVAATPQPGAVTTPTASIGKVVAARPIRAQTAVPAAPAPVAASAPVNTVQRSPLIQKLPAAPGSVKPATPAMPEAVVTQLNAMKAAANKLPQATPQSPALQQALAAAKESTTSPASLVKIGAAVAVIALMSGLVWMQNSPKLAFRTAATKAGIDASLPTYMPSSYHQKGSPTTANGLISLTYTSPSVATPLNIVQRRTNWDSNSLRENYVSTQSSDFVSVQGQGLVIYMHNDQANWVNHGVWYQLAGTTKLGREQVLKIAYGL